MKKIYKQHGDGVQDPDLVLEYDPLFKGGIDFFPGYGFNFYRFNNAGNISVRQMLVGQSDFAASGNFVNKVVCKYIFNTGFRGSVIKDLYGYSGNAGREAAGAGKPVTACRAACGNGQKY